MVSKPSSKIVRILGMFQIKPSGTDFIIMENIIKDKKNAVVFDLKGSIVHRIVDGVFDYSNPPYGMLLKDLNFKESNYRLQLSHETKHELYKNICKDVDLLTKYQIMDYSLLVAFYADGCAPSNRYVVKGNVFYYSIGIIDFLQVYGVAKASERFFKRILYRGQEISVEVPELYKERLKKLISYLIREAEEF